MRSCIVQICVTDLQNSMYVNAESNILKKIVWALPIAVTQTALDVIKYPLSAIERAAFTAINLVGCAFSKHCTFKDAIESLEFGLSNLLATPAAILISPLKIVSKVTDIVTTGNTFSNNNYKSSLWKTDDGKTLIYGN